jgi:hypothetical protein
VDAPAAGERKPSINSILRGLIGSSSASESRTLRLEDAHQEANQGLRKSQFSTVGTSKESRVLHGKVSDTSLAFY